MRLSYDYRPSRADRIYLEVLVWGFSAFRAVCELAALAQLAGRGIRRATVLAARAVTRRCVAGDSAAAGDHDDAVSLSEYSEYPPTFTSGMLIGLKKQIERKRSA